MTQATIEIDDHAVLAALDQLFRNVNHLEPALDEVGAAVEASGLATGRIAYALKQLTAEHDFAARVKRKLSY